MSLGITVFLHPATSLFVPVSTIALQLLRESYTGLLSATVICSSKLQPPNTLEPIVNTDSGIFMDIIFIPLKAPSARTVTVFGIEEFLHPKRKVFVLVSIMALQLLLESKTALSSKTVICSNLVQ